MIFIYHQINMNVSTSGKIGKIFCKSHRLSLMKEIIQTKVVIVV